MPTASKILVVTYGGGHVNMLLPVLKRLREHHQLVVLGLTTAGPVLENNGIPHLGFQDLVTASDASALAVGERLAKDVSHEMIPREETVAYLGLSYTDLEFQVGAEQAAKSYSEKGRAAFLPVATMQRMLRREQPDLVIATVSPRSEEAAILAAGELGIPSICLVDLFARPSMRRAARPSYATRLCVISEAVKQLAISYGRNADDVVVTGNPAFERLADPELAANAQKLRQTRGWNERKVVLWVSQVEPPRSPFSGQPGDPSLPRRIEAALCEIAESRGDWTLVIRPHPNERLDPERYPESVTFSHSSENLATLIQACDVVVIMTSTVGLEARFLHKPVISVDLSVFSHDTPYAELGLSIGVTELEKLEAAIEQGLATETRYPEGFPPLTSATDNIVAVVERVLDG